MNADDLSSPKPPINFTSELEGAGIYIQVNDQFLLLKRHPQKPQGNTWGIPGGKIEKGEDPLTAAIREVREETGIQLDPTHVDKVTIKYTRFQELNFTFHIFHVRLKDYPNIELALQEHIEAIWAAPLEVRNMPLISGGKDALDSIENFIQNN